MSEISYSESYSNIHSIFTHRKKYLYAYDYIHIFILILPLFTFLKMHINDKPKSQYNPLLLDIKATSFLHCLICKQDNSKS